MVRTSLLLMLGAAALWLGRPGSGWSQAPPRADEGIVLVVLKPQAQGTGLVLVGDIATVEGGSDELREKVRRLDLAEPSADRRDTPITRDQVLYRLSLGGLKDAQFRVAGPSRTLVRWGAPSFDESSLVEAAREAVRRRLPKGADEVSLQLVRPPQTPVLNVSPSLPIRLVAEVAGAAAAGRVRVDVSVLVNGQQRVQVPVFFDVGFVQDVAVVRRRINAGEVLSEDSLTRQRVELRQGEKFLAWTDAVGRRAKSQLLPGQTITDIDVDGGEQEQVILVKTRDTVRLVARIAGCRVTALGEALQDGRAGQVIRVRNVDSRKIVSGRVVDRNLVEVDF
jgi:flagella basal body P-ring formation protein FlgA